VPGTHSQSAGTNIHLTQSTLQLRGLNLIFNGDGGSTITLQDSVLEAYFRGEGQLLNVDISGAENTGRAYLGTPGERGFTTWGRAGFKAHVWYGNLATGGVQGLHIEQLHSLNTKIYSDSPVTQGDAIFNDGAMHVFLSEGGAIHFDHPENDFRRVDLNLAEGSSVELVDINSLYLGNIEAENASIQITALGSDGTIRQANDTTIQLNDSNSVITADIVLLGHNNNNFLRANNYSNLEVNFTQQAQVVDTGMGNIFWDTTRVTGTQDWLTVTASGSGANGPFRFNANTNNDRLNILGLIANDASIHAINDVRQTGAIQLSGTLNITSMDGEVILDNPLNHIQQIDLDSIYNSHIKVYGTGDMRIGNWSVIDSAIELRAFNGNGGEQGISRITQSANSHIYNSNSTIDWEANDIFLGAEGTSTIDLENFGIFNLRFNHHMHINGTINIGEIFTDFRVLGSSGDKTLTLGEHSDFNVGSSSGLLFSLASGRNTLHLHRDLLAITWTGRGPNTIYAYIPDIDPERNIVDFNPTKDTIVFVP
jgi:hypothetical protein